MLQSRDVCITTVMCHASAGRLVSLQRGCVPMLCCCDMVKLRHVLSVVAARAATCECVGWLSQQMYDLVLGCG